MKIHFVGIGGIGMSALAQHMAKKGHTISGSDAVKSEVTDMLESKGIKVFIGHCDKNVMGADLCVATSAASVDNPEILYCVQNKIGVLARQELLGKEFNAYKTRIGVSGTHGKTTTCGMLAAAFENCGHMPTAFIGGMTKRGNYIEGGEPCIAEACEYKASFLTLRPTIGVILNVETDHLDYYKDLLGVERAFSKFASKVDKDGYLVYNGDQVPEHILKITKAKRISYGFENNNDYQAVNLKHKKGVYAFDVIRDGKYFYSVELRIRGRHNIYNALATVVVCDLLNLDAAKCAEGINLFEGVERRWTVVENEFTNVVLDYAHHPNEIRALIETARQQGYEKIVMVFQPHTYSRTQTLFRDFVTCFKGVNELILLPIYAAREFPIPGVTSERLTRVINEVGITEARSAKDFDDCANIIKEKAGKDDLVLVVGAGDVNKLVNLLD